MNLLKEGGNVFKDKQGQPLTQRINQADVPATVKFIERATGIKFPQARWLGSTGRVPTSGDLDMAVDLSKITKDDLAARLTTWAQKNKLDPRDYVRKAGEVHFRTPIAGDPSRGYVQTDFMFFPDLNWGTFFYAGGESSAYKGVYRNILMSSIAKPLGLKIGARGMFSRTTNELIDGGMDPDYVAQVLLGPGKNRTDLVNVETIYQNLAQDPDRDAKLKDFREYLAREGLQEPILRENDVNFLARLRDRIVNQGMMALVEQEKDYTQPLREAREARIPYVEDLVFQDGLAGAKKALRIMRHSAANARDSVTIKWDGSPAVIFGRKPDTGEFVLTDKAGAVATGYDGLATSSRQIAQIMSQRDQDAAARGKTADRVEKLLPMYQELWPYLERATPANFRGYLKGDMLFSSTDPVRYDAGFLVFQPNKFGGIQYRIPESSALGQQIKAARVGLAVHTAMEDPNSAEHPEPNPQRYLNEVPGLMITAATVRDLENLRVDPDVIREINAMTTGENAQALKTFLNPAALRSWQLTDLPRLLGDFVNSLKGTDYSGATPRAFIEWMATKTTSRKQKNFIEYLGNPVSNKQGLSVAFTIWHLLHNLKQDLQRQLDLQQPGQEGWVMATPQGRAKLVSRTPGGFGARKKAATE